jgi:hypothetical protein
MRQMVLIAVFCAAFAAVVDAQTKCDPTVKGGTCQIELDRKKPVSGTSVRVPNGTEVTVLLKGKSPLESCKNEVKREEIADVSQLPALLDILKALGPGLLLPGGAPGGPPPPELDRLIDALAKAANVQIGIATAAQASYKKETDELQKFYANANKYTEADAAKFETERAARATAVDAALALPLPENAGLEISYKVVVAKLTAVIKSNANEAATILLESKVGQLRALLDGLAKAAETLAVAKPKLQATKEYLAELKEPTWSAVLRLRADRNAKVTGSIICKSDVTGNPTTDPIVYTVTYQDIQRFTVTSGILLSMVPRNNVAVAQVKDGVVDGVDTSHAEIRETKNAPQAIPFGMFNIRLARPWMAGGRVMTVHLSPGAGLNPNNGSPHAEFFMGAALGVDSFFFTVGAHAGHVLTPANDFAVGDRVAADLKLPLATPWQWKFAIGATYRIPLK